MRGLDQFWYGKRRPPASASSAGRSGRLSSFAALTVLTALSASTAPAQVCNALCGASALRPYFDTLEARRGMDGVPPVHILQIGDSITIGDAVTGAWRDILQARYGYGGRGVMPPGVPFAGYPPHGVHVDQSSGWKIEATFGKDVRPADPDAVFGVSSYRLTSQQDGASMTISAIPEPKTDPDRIHTMFNRMVICAQTEPWAGAYVVNLGETKARVSLAGAPGVSCKSFDTQGAQISASLTTEGGPVTLLSWGTFASNGGVVVSNLGIVGSQLMHFAHTSDRAVAEELRVYAPDLIVLAFGTNEGFVEHFDPEGFEYLLRNQIERLKRLSHGTPILLMGAPDAETNRPDLAHNAMQLASDGVNYGYGWYPPPAIARIREIQQRVAQSEGVAFWNWGVREGGPGTAQRWAAEGWKRPDRVHYLTQGGIAIARLLQDDLDRAEAAGASAR